MSKYLTPTLVGGIFAAGILVVLTILLWPAGLVVGSLLGILGLMLAIAMAGHIMTRRRYRHLWEEEPEALSPEELVCSLFDQGILKNITIRLIIFLSRDFNRMLVMAGAIVIFFAVYSGLHRRAERVGVDDIAYRMT